MTKVCWFLACAVQTLSAGIGSTTGGALSAWPAALGAYGSNPIQISAPPNVSKANHKIAKNAPISASENKAILRPSLRWPARSLLPGLHLAPSPQQRWGDRRYAGFSTPNSLKMPIVAGVSTSGEPLGSSCALHFRQSGIGQVGHLAEYRCPWKEERNFNIKNDEQQCDDIKPQVELHKARPDRRFAAFIDFQFFRIGNFGSNKYPTSKLPNRNTMPMAVNRAK